MREAQNMKCFLKIVAVVVGLLSVSGYRLVEAQQLSPTISVTVNKSMVFRLAQKSKRVSVSQPQVADVLVLSPSQLLINGKNIGTTSLIIFNDKGDVANYDLVVTPDVAALRAQFVSIFPEEKIEVSTSGPALVLRGEVSNETVYDRILEVAKTYLPPKPPAQVAPTTATTVSFGTASRDTIPSSGSGFAGGGSVAFNEEPNVTDANRWSSKRGNAIEGILDFLVIKEVRQIEIDIIVAEVSGNKLREIGFDLYAAGKNFASFIFPATQAFGLLDGTATPGGPITFNSDTTSGAFQYQNGSFAATGLYRLLQNRDVSHILAQPRITVKNGRVGGFLAGGEIPIPISNAFTTAVEFKPFGVRLDFLPTITWSDRIDLRIFPEVSNLSALRVNGIPGLETRRSISRVEMKEGESLILGGLLNQNTIKNVSKFPILGDIPILGALFRSTSFSNQESELIIVVTPRIVRTFKPGEGPQLPSIEKYDDPDIRQVPVPNSSASENSTAPKASMP